MKFFISLGYSVPSFFGAHYFITKYRNLQAKEVQGGPKIQSVNKNQLPFHPFQIAFFILLLVTAWGLAECWRIANELWLDWTKAKEAVPIVGKAWAEKGRKKKEEQERASKN